MNSDADIKIVGDKPSEDIKRNIEKAAETGPGREAISKAEKWGREVALVFAEDAKESAVGKSDCEMLIQRRLLLSFTATVGFEQFCKDDTLIGIAQKSFLDTLKNTDNELYLSSEDTGAFSFYYLAFRRGGETERRMGQTFAMLCAHDGDPIYQELGEALYCWFLSVVKKTARETDIT